MEITREKYFNEDRGPDQRFVDPDKRRTWVVSKMWDMHLEIVRLLSIGLNNKRVAEKLGISAQTVSNVKNSPMAQLQLNVVRGARDADIINVSKRIKEKAPDAIRLLEEIIDGETDASINLRAKTAESILDRAGLGATKKFEGVMAHLSGDEIMDIKRRASESQGQIIDADYTSEEVG